MSRARGTMTGLEHGILRELARVGYATTAQLATWSHVSLATAGRAAAALSKAGLVRVWNPPRPAIWGLAGTASLRRPRASWHLMAHVCHRNALEIELSRQLGGFCFLPRPALLCQGLRPAQGEHGGLDASGRSWLALVDDGAVAGGRIAHAWRRRHTPDPRYWPDPTGRAWCEVVHRFVVGCTDPARTLRHRGWIATHDVPASVCDIPLLWPD